MLVRGFYIYHKLAKKLNFHNFGFFIFNDLLNLGNVCIRRFLYVGFVAFQIIFRNFCRFLGFFQFLQYIAAFVAHGYFKIFAHFGNVFCQLFAAVFRHRRQGNADNFPVVYRACAEVGLLQSAVNIV